MTDDDQQRHDEAGRPCCTRCGFPEYKHSSDGTVRSKHRAILDNCTGFLGTPAPSPTGGER